MASWTKQVFHGVRCIFISFWFIKYFLVADDKDGILSSKKISVIDIDICMKMAEAGDWWNFQESGTGELLCAAVGTDLISS